MMKNIFNYFLRGLLFVLPVVLTIYIIVALVQWTNGFFNELFNIDIPGLGIIAIFILITLTGFLFSQAFIKPVVEYFESLLARVPLVKIIYTSIKELTEAFVGDKKKFNKPVIIDFISGDGMNVKRVGFITQTDLTALGLKEMVSVYCPHSYNISGNVYIVSSDAITPLDLNAADVMKYVISGGVTKLDA